MNYVFYEKIKLMPEVQSIYEKWPKVPYIYYENYNTMKFDINIF